MRSLKSGKGSYQCFGSGFRDLLDLDLDLDPDPGAYKNFKMLNNHNTILLFSDFYNILSFTIDFFPNLDFWLDPDSMNMDTKHWTLLKIKDDG